MMYSSGWRFCAFIDSTVAFNPSKLFLFIVIIDMVGVDLFLFKVFTIYRQRLIGTRNFSARCWCRRFFQLLPLSRAFCFGP